MPKLLAIAKVGAEQGEVSIAARTANEKPSMAAFEEDAPTEEAEAANDEKVISLEAFRKC